MRSVRHLTVQRTEQPKPARRLSILSLSLLFAMAIPEPQANATSNGIIGESIDLYSPCNIFPDLVNDKANVEGFLNNMPANGTTSWPVWADWTDNGNCWDADFVDSDLFASGDDNVSFDPPGAAIAMYSGHGVCNDFPTPDQSCTASAQCTNPGTGMSNPGSCTKGPNVAQGMCIYTAPREIVTCDTTNDKFGHHVDYSDGATALGESTNSGAWAGAGTNGGINFAILDISCGVRPGHVTQGLGLAFAGVHNIATCMPTTAHADTTDSALRGTNFAARWKSNKNSSIAMSWTAMMNDMPWTEGLSCNGTTKGYHGYAGCGANLVASLAQDTTTAYFLNGTESWVQAQSDTNDPTAGAVMAWIWICNYDCSANPLTI